LEPIWKILAALAGLWLLAALAVAARGWSVVHRARAARPSGVVAPSWRLVALPVALALVAAVFGAMAACVAAAAT
jgi:hypothetical protein